MRNSLSDHYTSAERSAEREIDAFIARVNGTSLDILAELRRETSR